MSFMAKWSGRIEVSNGSDSAAIERNRSIVSCGRT